MYEMVLTHFGKITYLIFSRFFLDLRVPIFMAIAILLKQGQYIFFQNAFFLKKNFLFKVHNCQPTPSKILVFILHNFWHLCLYYKYMY